MVSVPNGAGGANLQWLDRFVDQHFDDKAEIILAMDTDKRGVALRDELVRRLGVDRCKVVAWGEGCKDANEYLLKSIFRGSASRWSRRRKSRWKESSAPWTNGIR